MKKQSAVFSSFALATCLFFVLQCAPASAIDAGGKIPEIRSSVPNWFGTEKPFSDGKKEPEIEILMFFDASAPDAVSFLRMLETLGDKYAENTEHPVRLSAVSRNSVRMTEELLKSSGVSGLMVGADDKRELYMNLAASEPMMPFAIVAKKNRVLWTGHPTDIESVTDRILKDRFDLSTQGQVAMLRRELQAAVQSSLPDVIQRSADKILAILPGDSIAVQSKLYVYDLRGQNREALDFLKEQTVKVPEELNLRILYLDMLLRNGENALFRETMQKAASDFHSSPESLFRILAFSLEAAPHGALPLSLVWDLAKRIRKDFSQARADKKALSLEFSARAASLIGDLASAVKDQAAALELRKGTVYEKAAADLLDYYRTAQELQIQHAGNEKD